MWKRSTLSPPRMGSRLRRSGTGARWRFEERVLDAAGGRLPETLKAMLDASLADADPVTGFTGLKADPG